MNLTWHMVRKDVRRFAWPVGAWLLLLFLGAAVIVGASWEPAQAEWTEAGEWIRNLRSGTMALAFIGTSAVVLLVGVLVLEDRVEGSTSFWQTRPIAGGRLLRAKVLAAVLMLVLAPLAVHLPVWLAAGFDGGEIQRSAVAMLLGCGLLVLGALGIAVLTANLGQHAFAVLTMAGLTLFLAQILPLLWEGIPGRDAIESQVWLVVGTYGLTAIAALLWQYYTRRTAIGWSIWVVALGGAAFIRLFWSWDFVSAARWERPTADEQRLEVVLRFADGSIPVGRPSSLRIAMTTGSEPGEFFAPFEGGGLVRAQDGTEEVRLGRVEHWSQIAARVVVAGSSAPAPLEWPMAVNDRKPRPEMAGSAETEFSGRVRFARLRGRVLYELPWREGAVAQSGGSRSRLVGGLMKEPGTMMIEERTATKAMPGVQNLPIEIDTLVLVHRATGEIRAVRHVRHAPASTGGVRIELGKLTPEPGEHLRAEEWKLVKVRFEPLGWFEREFTRVAILHAESGAKR